MCSVRNLVQHIHIAANVYEYQRNFARSVTWVDSKKYDMLKCIIVDQNVNHTISSLNSDFIRYILLSAYNIFIVY